MGEVGVAAAGGGGLQAARQRVRAGGLQLPYGHREPVERVVGGPARGRVGGGPPVAFHLHGHDEGGGHGGPVGQGVAQRGVTDGSGEGGESGQNRGGQEDGQDGCGEKEPMGPHPQKDEPRHLAP